MNMDEPKHEIDQNEELKTSETGEVKKRKSKKKSRKSKKSYDQTQSQHS